MDTLNRIIDLMKLKNCDNQMLASALGLNRQVVTDWKAERSKSYMKYLPQIADYFGVTVDYLIGQNQQADEAELPAADAAPIQTAYDNASPEIQTAVRKLLDL